MSMREANSDVGFFLLDGVAPVAGETIDFRMTFTTTDIRYWLNDTSGTLTYGGTLGFQWANPALILGNFRASSPGVSNCHIEYRVARIVDRVVPDAELLSWSTS